jgi:hypothetical protein
MELNKFRVSDNNRITPESKAEWTEAEKFDYLTSLSLTNSMWWIFTQSCGLASGLGLIVFFVAYILGSSSALALFLFLLCSWLGWLLAYRLVRGAQALPPWMGIEAYREQHRHLWDCGPRKPPLIEDRLVPILDQEAEARSQRLHAMIENHRKEEEQSRKHRAAHKLRRSSLPRRLKRNWYLVKRRLKVPMGR